MVDSAEMWRIVAGGFCKFGNNFIKIKNNYFVKLVMDINFNSPLKCATEYVAGQG
jgi:hypothetical protein